MNMSEIKIRLSEYEKDSIKLSESISIKKESIRILNYAIGSNLQALNLLNDNTCNNIEIVVTGDLRKIIYKHPDIVFDNTFININKKWKMLKLEKVNDEGRIQLKDWIEVSLAELKNELAHEISELDTIVKMKETILHQLRDCEKLGKKILYEIPLSEQEPFIFKLKSTIEEKEKEIKYLTNELYVAHNLLKELRLSRQIILYPNYSSRIGLYREGKLLTNDIELLKKDLQSEKSDCMKKNGTINFNKLSKKLGVNNKTALSWYNLCGIK